MTARGHHSCVTVFIAVAIAALRSGGAGAFGDPAHRVIGRIAEIHLANSRALMEVRKILRPQETLADAAVWPDTIKTITYEDPDTGFFRLKHPAHDVYHFSNVPFQETKYDAAGPGAHSMDIVRITRECIRVLRGQSQVFSRREAMRLLAHLLGDIHQPLHVGVAFVSAEGPLRFVVPDSAAGWRSTVGDNLLRYGPNDNFNLHSYWDAHVVNLAMQSDDVSTYAARLVKEMGVLPTWKNTGDPDAWPALWATEVLGLAKEAHAGIKITAYLGPDPDRGLPHRWRIEQPAGYDGMAKARVRVQLAKSGYRLAATLRAIWPDQK
jgi:S1/P1 Nuclease